MSTQVPIGNVGFIPLGDYIEGTLYQRLHVVRHDNNLYCCLRETTEIPTIFSNDWMLLIEGTNTSSAAVIDVNFGDLTEFQNIPSGTDITYLFPEEFLVLLKNLKNNMELPPYIIRFRFKQNNRMNRVFNVDFTFENIGDTTTLGTNTYAFNFKIPDINEFHLKAIFGVHPDYPDPVIQKY
ncbi:MAG: hypothetical protein MJ191_00130 [Clostridium sp.]|nr:hypothetical protein [Clostridium sp.]